MLVLKEESLISKGSGRNVYLDPENSNRCIKITTLERKKYRRSKTKHWYKKIRRLDSFDENIKEIRAYKKMNRKNPEIYNNIPKFYGTVETNMGNGIVVEYIDNSTSLGNFIKNYGVTQELLLALKEMFNIFIKNNIEIRDFQSENYLVKDINGKLRIYIIDGLGNANLIPISEWIPYFGRKKIIRRIKKMLILLKNEFPEYKDKFEFEKITNPHFQQNT